MLTQDRLKELLTYDPASGELHWKRHLIGRMKPRAGWSRGEGHRHIFIDGHRMLEHRAVWLYMTGFLPEDEIDHIDLDKTNNRWANLRLASRSQNSCNRSAQANSSLGMKGVAFWTVRGCTYARAKVTVQGRTHEKLFAVAKLGIMEAVAAASVWAKETRTILHGDFANHSGGDLW